MNPRHVLLTPATCDCDKHSDTPCNVCDGGLAICAKCGKAESELDQRCEPREKIVAEDIVRVLRVIEYEGPRAAVELQVRNSLHGERDNGKGVTIRAATVGGRRGHPVSVTTRSGSLTPGFVLGFGVG